MENTFSSAAWLKWSYLRWNKPLVGGLSVNDGYIMLDFDTTVNIPSTAIRKAIVHYGWVKIKTHGKKYKVLLYNDATLVQTPKSGPFGGPFLDPSGQLKQKSQNLLNVLRSNNVKTKNRIWLNIINVSLAIIGVIFLIFLLVVIINIIRVSK